MVLVKIYVFGNFKVHDERQQSILSLDKNRQFGFQKYMLVFCKMLSGLIFMQISAVARAVRDEDFEIVESCCMGNVDSFGVLVERYQKKMLNTAFRIIGDYEDASDAVQDAFLAAYKALPGFKGDSRFLTWLTSIVVNHAKNKLSQHKTLSKYIAGSIDETVETDEGSLRHEHASNDDSPHERLEKGELDKRVQKCICMLDPEYREVLVLREIHGYSYEELSEMLKLPEGTVKSRLFRAKGFLKDSLLATFGEAW
jgi:RNA polymerase sigma-70 factor, ECF subfamily